MTPAARTPRPVTTARYLATLLREQRIAAEQPRPAAVRALPPGVPLSDLWPRLTLLERAWWLAACERELAAVRAETAAAQPRVVPAPTLEVLARRGALWRATGDVGHIPTTSTVRARGHPQDDADSPTSTTER